MLLPTISLFKKYGLNAAFVCISPNLEANEVNKTIKFNLQKEHT